jgi:hypothetical protein
VLIMRATSSLERGFFVDLSSRKHSDSSQDLQLPLRASQRSPPDLNLPKLIP